MTKFEEMTIVINSYTNTAQEIERDGLGQEPTIRKMISEKTRQRLELTIEEAEEVARF